MNKKFLGVLISTVICVGSIFTALSVQALGRSMVPSPITKYVRDYSVLFQNFLSAFKEGQPVDESKVCLRDFVINDKNKPYKVKVTFVSSIASFSNQFGYFVYKNRSSISPKGGYIRNVSQANIKEQTVIFNNVKECTAGQSIQFGTFSPNESVGFFIKSNEGTFYSVKALNPDSTSHTAKYKDYDKCNMFAKKLPFVALGFEDRIQSASDRDFNDILLTVEVSDAKFKFGGVFKAPTPQQYQQQ